ncbi:NAD(+) diphosphatase [Microbacterium sp. ARD31]|jgi:NAD+ diphosphatase|uniref:NAD(+) diphosphatase n=1 Tax=Microbacterium sp. ARD31 TaxID=2962576 RepID=UPI0028815616|nr:NAD(+) diphosphatase [Microbacterium sp. ARD31]MDT0179976.1 NAD(+) diphosphatase [Microbacterium sp. ARD31]
MSSSESAGTVPAGTVRDSAGRDSAGRDSADALARAAAERLETGLLERLRADPATRVLALHGDASALTSAGRIDWMPPDRVPGDVLWAFLGRAATGEALLAAVYPEADAEPFAPAGGWGALRTVAADLDAADAAAFVTAVSLGRWLREAPFCPACGTMTLLSDAGWSRRCPSCARQHFPRTDPAVIVAIQSARDPDLLLLGSNALWGAGRYSCFAGFVEAGESLETAVHREVAEEAGVTLSSVRYRGSQPWPYPRSLMVGFLATATDEDAARPDGEEIIDVRWFTRAEIGAGLAGEGPLTLPGAASIAHRLIADWHRGTE